MQWNTHSELDGLHAFLSPSKYHWINYTKDKLETVYAHHLATQRGTELHEFAEQAIKLKRHQPKNKDTVNMYINDAIGFRMRTEQPLMYSMNCFGTCDAISYNEQRRMLRIHDLKTGETPAHMWQLKIYAALFILEYGAKLGIMSPRDINIEMRIYQSGEVITEVADPEEIAAIMNTIIESDKVLDNVNLEE